MPSYFALGINLGTLDQAEHESIHEYLLALHVMLNYFEVHDKRRQTEVAAAAKKIKKKKSAEDTLHASSRAISPVSSSSSGHAPTLGRDAAEEHNHGQQRSLSQKGRKLFFGGRSKKKDEYKKIVHKLSSNFGSFMPFSSHHHEYDETESNSSDDFFHSLSPDTSVASPEHTSTPSDTRHQQKLRNRSKRSTMTFFTLNSNSSSNNLGPAPPYKLANLAPENQHNVVNGTGTYTMGNKKMYFGNSKADHSSINQNQLTEPELLPGLIKSSGSKTVIEGLFLVNEGDLPFMPDTLESIITLLDTLTEIYRNIRGMVNAQTLTQSDLSRVDITVLAVDEIVMRTIFSKELLALDAEYVKRSTTTSISLSRDLIQRDILRISSQQPNANYRASMVFSAKSPLTSTYNEGIVEEPANNDAATVQYTRMVAS